LSSDSDIDQEIVSAVHVDTIRVCDRAEAVSAALNEELDCYARRRKTSSSHEGIARMTSANSEFVLVVGASGKLGSEVLGLLGAREIRVRAATRFVDKRTSDVAGTEWAPFDLEQPQTFTPALVGVTRVLLMARPGDEHPERTSLPLIEAMKHTGVEHVVNVSAMGTELRPDFGLRKVELALEASGLSFTHLRPNFFMQIFAAGPHYAQIMARRQIRLPAADARISFIDVKDIAEVATQCLLDDTHRGKVFTLTGGQALSHADVAAHIAAASESAIDYVDLSEDEARSEWSAAGLPAANVERLIGFYRIVRTGAAATVSPCVEQLLGRMTRTFADFAKCSRAAWDARQ
jgi:uncharacterized protein YbjT (DUF2867 family)